jgi:ankyrin repeat protein
MVAKKKKKGIAFIEDKSIDFFNAAVTHNDAEVAALLTDARVDVNWLDSLGQSSLMVTAYLGHTSIVAKLLGCEKVEVNAVRKDHGFTALLFAVYKEHEPVVAQLVKCERVDVNL